MALVFAAGPAAYIVAAMAILEGAFAPFGAWLLKLLIDALFGPSGAAAGRAVLLGALLVLTGLVAGVQRPLSGYVAAVLGRALRLRTKNRLLRRVNELVGLEPFENPAFLDRLRLAAQSGERAPDELMRSAITIVEGAVRVGGFAALLVAVWPPMALLVVAGAVPASLLQLHIGRQRAAVTAGLIGLLRRQWFFESLLTDARAAKEIRLFGTGEVLHGRLLADLRRTNAEQDRMDRRVVRGEVAMEAIGAVLGAIAVTAVIVLATRAKLTPGDVAAFLGAVAGVSATAVTLASAVGHGYEALLLFGAYHDIVVGRPVAEALAGTALAGTAPVGASTPPLRHGVEFRDVWFRYTPAGPWVLRGVSFTLPFRATVGLVGLNGAGKSTLVKLLCRMYEPDRGQILWDDQDIGHLDPVALRQRIGAVFQDFMAYDLTARENIGLGDVRRMDDAAAIRGAAEIADVHAELAALPGGYDTLLSRVHFPDDDNAEPFAQLSGGQWQRVALARAFLRDAELLVLDEPSSGLDAAAEAALHQRLWLLRQDRTTLLISHRLGTLRDADLLVVLAGGRVAEQGTHAELMTAGGAYAELFALQAHAYRDESKTDVAAEAQLSGLPAAWSGSGD
jgi:ATP-binding cassette subfamily B protein